VAFAIVSTLAFILHARRTFAVAMNWWRYRRFMDGLTRPVALPSCAALRP